VKLTKKTSTLLTVCGVLFVVITTIYVALSRFVARDEGYFLYAARMLQDGILPYRDFFFPQTPLAPILFSVWFDLTETGWYEARILTAILTSLSAVLLFALARVVYSTSTAILSLFVFGVTVGILVWLPTAQAHCVTTNFLLSALVALRVCNNSFLAGAMFGFSIASRLTVAPFFIVMLIEAARKKTSRIALESVWKLCFGMLIPMLSLLSIAIVDIENFFEHNLRYHFERTSLSENQIAANRSRIVAALFGMRAGTGLGGLQFQVLLYTTLLGLLWSSWRYFRNSSSRRISGVREGILDRIDPFVLGAVILFMVHLVPEPTYLQYFSLVQMLLIPPCLYHFLTLMNHFITRSWEFPPFQRFISKVSLAIVTALFLTMYSLLGVPDIQKYLYTGDDVIGVGRLNREAWRLHTVKEISNRIDQYAGKNDYVLTSWPGYCVETKAHIVPGIESNFGPQWARNAMFSKDEQSRRKILSWERAVKRFTKDRAKLAVLFLGIGRTNNLEREVIKAGGVKVSSLSGIGMYRKSV
jgi:hypothetical protein